MKIIALSLLVLFGAGVARADDRAVQLDAFYTAQAQAGGFNGTVLIAEQGRVVYQKAFGYADFEAKRLNTMDTEFELASVSKVFTAISVLQLVERGQLKLDAPYAAYVPAFPYKAITLRQLLSHSSGLKEFDDALSAYEKAQGRPITMADQVPAIAAGHVDLALKPGEKWWYSNQGYHLLAYLVERVSGQRFDAYLKAHILNPAGMSYTYLKTAAINHVDTPTFAQNYAYPFRYSSQRIRLEGARSYYNGLTYGPANIISTAGDMLKLDTALYDGRLLKAQTQDEAYTPVKLADGHPDFVWANIGGMGDADDGLGWFIFRDTSDGRIVWHAGGMAGCVTLFMRNITRHQTVIILDNTESPAFYKKGLSGMRILNGQPPLEITQSLAKLYGRALMDQGAEAAFGVLQAHKDDPAHYAISEDDMNNMAYEMLAQGYVPQALETFRTNIWLYPHSDNVYESYAEALEKASDRAGAIDMYRKALTFDPANADALAALKRLGI